MPDWAWLTVVTNRQPPTNGPSHIARHFFIWDITDEKLDVLFMPERRVLCITGTLLSQRTALGSQLMPTKVPWSLWNWPRLMETNNGLVEHVTDSLFLKWH
jgi:hypothetical protein